MHAANLLLQKKSPSFAYVLYLKCILGLNKNFSNTYLKIFRNYKINLKINSSYIFIIIPQSFITYLQHLKSKIWQRIKGPKIYGSKRSINNTLSFRTSRLINKRTFEIKFSLKMWWIIMFTFQDCLNILASLLFSLEVSTRYTLTETFYRYLRFVL